MASSLSSTNEAMKRPNLDPRPQPLQCPRCDSSNTKFCYYNNYSLSQPRHFCKACKRYWTEGGTLRNVPVGGGCRKNKKAKRQAPPSHAGGDGILSSTASTATIQAADVDLSPTPNHVNNPLFYTLPANPLELNFPFSVSASVRVSSNSNRFDRQPQMNGYGVGFSSGNMAEDSLQNTDRGNAFRQIHQDVVISTTSAGNNPIFFGSPALLSPTSTKASMLASSFQQQRFASSGFQSLRPHEHMQMPRGDEVMGKDQEKIGGQNRLEWNHNQTEQIINTSDSSSLLWNTANEGEWFDPPDMGSSVPSLI